MRTSEVTRSTTYVCALVMVMCALWGSQAAFGAGEPNSPVTPDANALWDPATHLTADWTSVSLTSQIDKSSDSPGPQTLESSRSLTISGEVNIIDSNGLIGLTSSVASAFVTDENGREIPNSSGSFPVRFYQPPHSMPAMPGLAGGLQPYHFSVSMPMDPNVAYPQRVSRMEWSMYALVAETYEVVDVPFKVTQDWIQVVPGLEILVEQATAEGNKYQYNVRARFNVKQVDWLLGGSVFMREGDELADRLMLEIQILNAQGKPVRSGSGAFGSSSSGSGSGNQMTYTMTGQGTCENCGAAATFRYRLAVNPYEQEVRFVLENIPVPTF